MLGSMYSLGEGVKQNTVKAVYWYQKAAEQADQKGLNNIVAFIEGKEKIYWLKKAAENGVLHAQHELAQCYEYGDGIHKNFKLAEKWYQRAADNGYDYANIDLAQFWLELKQKEKYKKAEKMLVEVKDSCGEYWEYYFTLGELYSKMNKTDQSQISYKQALALILKHIKECYKCIVDSKKIIKAETDNLADYQNFHKLIKFCKKQKDKGLVPHVAFQKWEKQTAEKGYYSSIALVFEDDNYNLPELKEVIKADIENRPDHANLYFGLALCCFKMANYPEAEKAVKKAIEMKKQYIRKYVDLIEIYHEEIIDYEKDKGYIQDNIDSE